MDTPNTCSQTVQIIPGRVGGCPMHGSPAASLTSTHSFSSTPPSATQEVSRCCQIRLGGQSCPQLRTTDVVKTRNFPEAQKLLSCLTPHLPAATVLASLTMDLFSCSCTLRNKIYTLWLLLFHTVFGRLIPGLPGALVPSFSLPCGIPPCEQTTAYPRVCRRTLGSRQISVWGCD